jgi:long-chain acyl-CoA synthetase
MPPMTFWSRAAGDPDHVAMIDPSGRAIRAGDLLASTNRLVHGLRALGLEPGDAIASMLPNSPEAYELQLAIQQAGWYMTPVNYHFVGPEIAYILRDCEAKAFIAHERYAEAADAAVKEAGFPEAGRFSVGVIPGFRPYADLTDGQIASPPLERLAGRMMMYTSGTTGRPKGVRRPLPGVEPEQSNFTAALDHYRLQERSDHVQLLACPWYHTAPNVMSIASLHLGHTLAQMDHFDAEQTLAHIERYRVTLTHLVPTQFVRLLALSDEVKARYDLSSLRHVIHGAAPCSPEVKRRMLEWWGPVIYEYYSSTEGGGTVAYPEDALERPGTVGKVWVGSDLRVLDDDGTELPPGQVGTIYIRNSQGPLEYFKDPEKTRQALRGNYVTVGDAGYFDEDGFLFLCDRKTDMIISGGVNIYPAEIEHVLITHPAVRDVAVFGIPNGEWGEAVKAVVELAADAEPGPALAAALRTFCEGKLARYKIPGSIDFIQEMPRDPNGKLYKRMLREQYR